MAQSKRSTAKKDEGDVIEADEIAAEPTVEEPEAAAEPKSAPRRAPADGAPQEVALPYRVETFSVDGKWGWRLCGADGQVVRESSVEADDREQAAVMAEEEDFGASVVMVTRNRPAPGPRRPRRG